MPHAQPIKKNETGAVYGPMWERRRAYRVLVGGGDMIGRDHL
jgi:hypothetical protein